jgi:glycosyltransferase involved in cell wall biosynthesis
MRIAIDYNAALRQIAGIGRYTRELVGAMAEARRGDEFLLFYASRDLQPDAFGRQALAELEADYPTIRSVAIPISERWLTILWQRFRLPVPVELWTGPVDLVHAPDFVLPPTRTGKTILTVHDLTFRVHPETAHTRLRQYLERAVPRSLGRAMHVLADSQSTAADLQRLMRVPASKISVLYPGIGTQFRPVHDPAMHHKVRERYRLPEHYVLHVGTLEPRKNLERLILAMQEVREDHPDIGLVLVGKPGWLSEPILERARTTPGVLLIGPVPDDDLPVLYTLARGTVYPSLYEGFGFPPLESVACGTPVMMSNTSSLPELAIAGTFMVDPHRPEALTDGLRRLLNDRELRQTARDQGAPQARRWNWPAAAGQLLDLYHVLGK